MKKFFFFSAAYLILSAILALLLRQNAVALLDFELVKLFSRAWRFVAYLKYVGVVLLLLLYFSRNQNLKTKIVNAILAFFGCLMFTSAFSITKTTIPYVVPFYADEMLANLDKALHFGTDPWEIVHQFSPYVPVELVEMVYFTLWVLPAFFLPVFIALTDDDETRNNRFMVLYCSCWIVLGNVLALLFSSVGPVYYDLLLGGDRFSGLIGALEASGISTSKIGEAQAFLWDDYSNRSQAIGAGISAFPSVHVGVATVIALYLAERRSYLLAPGLIFLAAVLFCSIYNGWHYAIDGYASIIVLTTIWAWQKHRATSPQNLALV